MKDSGPSKPKRREYRFSLWTLVVLAGVIGLASWYGIGIWREEQRERQRETQLQNQQREKEKPAKQQQEWRKQQESVLAKLEPFGPRGEYAGNEVCYLRFSSKSLTDDDLQHVKGLTGLSYLSLLSQRKVSEVYQARYPSSAHLYQVAV